MKKVQLLDCTLRDGGYVNDWNFGNSTINCIYDRLVRANVDIVEVGFLDDRRKEDLDRTIQPRAECYNSVFQNIMDRPKLIVAMIDYGTCEIKNICNKKESILDGIRLIFKKSKIQGAVEYAKQLINKGYKVFLQMVSITSYDDADVLEFIKIVNVVSPYCVSIVDTYGLMHKEESFRYFHLLDQNLDPEIMIGYHSHNNFQLAYANTIEIIKQKTNREMIIDGTIYGMGKSAGNAPTELLAMHLNEKFNGTYDISQILETIDTNIMSIYQEHYWGYSMLYFLAASNDCHPSYINYLLEKKTLSVTNINEILKDIPSDLKLNFNKECIEVLYVNYQKRFTTDNNSFHEFLAQFEKKSIILLGPGPTIKQQYEKVMTNIKNHLDIVVSINCLPDEYPVEYTFINNSKRYSLLLPQLKKRSDVELILTSNILSTSRASTYVINYGTFLDENDAIRDNALIMFINLMISAGARKLSLAGFDGFTKRAEENYYNSFLEVSLNENSMQLTNKAIAERIPEFRNRIEIEFITDSLYESAGK